MVNLPLQTFKGRWIRAGIHDPTPFDNPQKKII
jgi:hypothetical protein